MKITRIPFSYQTTTTLTLRPGILHLVSFIVVLHFSLPSVEAQQIYHPDLTIQSFATQGLGPIGLTFDGVNIWAVNQNSNNVSKLRASDGTVLGVFPVGGGPAYAAF